MESMKVALLVNYLAASTVVKRARRMVAETVSWLVELRADKRVASMVFLWAV